MLFRSDLAAPLPPGSIKEPEDPVHGLGSVSQPTHSFGGRPAESTELFHARVRERIRHKNRAITPRDIEHLVLEAFPSLLAVRVVPASLRHPAPQPGCVTIVVVPRPAPGQTTLTPMANPALLEEITRSVQRIAPEGSTFLAVNPTYIPLTVRATLTTDQIGRAHV